MVDQNFGRLNDPMSQPTVDSTHLGTNTTDRTMLPIDSIPVGTKMTEPNPLELPTYLPGDPDLDPSLSDSSKKSNFSNNNNSS